MAQGMGRRTWSQAQQEYHFSDLPKVLKISTSTSLWRLRACEERVVSAMGVGSLNGRGGWLEATTKEVNIMGSILVPDGSVSSLSSQHFSKRLSCTMPSATA